MSMKRILCSIFVGTLAVMPCLAEESYVDLGSLFDQDAFVQSPPGLTDPLAEDDNYLDSTTLPADYEDGSAYPVVDGVNSFMYGVLQSEELDSVLVDGQTFEVSSGNYTALYLALLSPEGGVTDLSKSITLNYADGNSEEVQFGPFTEWIDSPLRFYDQEVEFIDDSDITTYLDIQLQQNDQDYIFEIIGDSPNEPRDDYRFVDGNAELIYEFDLEDDLTSAKMGIDMSNNFVVEISNDFGDTYTEVLNSMDMFGEDVHDSSNRDVYEVDLTSFLETIPDNIIHVRFTDGTPSDGWGPSIWNISIFSGEMVRYEDLPTPNLNDENAEILADFRTNTDAEDEYLIDHQSSLSGAGHRYADGDGYFIYEFDFEEDLTEAKALINMEGDFVTSISTNRDMETVLDFQPGGDRDEEYIFEDNGSANAGSFRFVDGSGSLSYILDLPDDLTEATLNINMQNNFVVSLAGYFIEYEEVLNSMEMFGEDIHDGSNNDVYSIDLSSYLEDNDPNEIFVLFEDGTPDDGWGPAIFNISVTTGGAGDYTEILTADEVFADSLIPYDGTHTRNKDYYDVDLTPFLGQNESNSLALRFTDGNTDNGWGPGVFRILVYTGELSVQHDSLAMAGLDTTNGLPSDAHPWGVNLFSRAYPVDSDRTLESATLPEMDQNVFLFAATLEGTTTSVNEWSLY